eukprot:CAMPEP_0206123124 /NCGR_PEP_ID=MMETSP1472-20131121/2551_1 /ASSEMBLY_ACC=CAM_ASM_001108 /TAXON_ID=41880 /ORGANISM="Pycnococcus provasolii, Strain RCC251" /LENGTH=250 /DNA_ID=CAMNT_0053513667 /DNA_START=219 /DNA_END=972 /DNA_ORIENTATION=-
MSNGLKQRGVTIEESIIIKIRLVHVICLQHVLAARDFVDFRRRAARAAVADDSFHHVEARSDGAEHDVLVVEVRALRDSHEELVVVGIRAAVRHAQQKRLIVTKRETLILEPFAVNARMCARTAALHHEFRYDAVKCRSHETIAVSANAQSLEVCRSSRNMPAEECHLDGAALSPIVFFANRESKAAHSFARAGSATLEEMSPGSTPHARATCVLATGLHIPQLRTHFTSMNCRLFSHSPEAAHVAHWSP